MEKRKAVGRPRRPDRGTIRDQRIASAYTRSEREELEDLAHDNRVSLSEYIRRIVIRHLSAKRGNR